MMFGILLVSSVAAATEVVFCGSVTYGNDVTIEMDMVVAGNVMFANDDTVVGSILAGGNIIAGNDFTVEGSLLGRHIVVGNDFDGRLVAAEGDVTGGNDFEAQGYVVSLAGSVTLGNDAYVEGIVAARNIHVGNHFTSATQLVAGGRVSVGNHASIGSGDAPNNVVDPQSLSVSPCPHDLFKPGKVLSTTGGGLSVGSFFSKVFLGPRTELKLKPSGNDDLISIGKLVINGDFVSVLIPDQGVTLYVQELDLQGHQHFTFGTYHVPENEIELPFKREESK